MEKLFSSLVNYNLIKDWAEILDWLFDEEKFSSDRNWSSEDTKKFCKRVKDDLLLKKEQYYKYDSIKNIQEAINEDKNYQIKFIHSKGSKINSQGKDIVRHLRNGIAHGRTKVERYNNELYIEIKDFNNQNKQTAYIYIPINYISQIHKIYSEIEKGLKNDKNIRKKNKRKQELKD